MVLIKDNHLRYVGSIFEAVCRVRDHAPAGAKIEVEVTDLDEAAKALAAKPDIVMLDNMSVTDIRSVVTMYAGRIPIEVSGKVTLDRARELAAIGVDFISVGSLTHSSKAVDISLEFLN